MSTVTRASEFSFVGALDCLFIFHRQSLLSRLCPFNLQLVLLVRRFGIFFLHHTASGFQLWFYFQLCMWVIHWDLVLQAALKGLCQRAFLGGYAGHNWEERLRRRSGWKREESERRNKKRSPRLRRPEMNVVKLLVAQSCPTLCDPVDCSPPGSSVCVISQARILQWVVISFSRGSSWPTDRNLLHWQVDSWPLIHQQSPNSPL